ncbi:lysoplasmalogenase family protein [Streptomyces sp. NPDC018019]|uniref:lysoplasmalogenase family protein n=1 Tax=Streptomyces sp. NPDC018019 TaxID=3365030 RepID=UPI0037A83B5C
MTTAARAARVLLGAFAALALVHLGALLAEATTLAHLTKPALMPVLAAYVLAAGAPRLLAVALLLGCGGDTLLQTGDDGLFLAGMGSFAAGHLCYLVLLVRRGAFPGGLRLAGPLAACYAAAWLGFVALLWPDLTADLRLPVAAYSLLLTATAFAALRPGPRAALGGLLFLLSDALLATGLAHWQQPPAAQFWVMLTYTAAQYALADGVRRVYAGRERPGAAGPARAYGEVRRTTV